MKIILPLLLLLIILSTFLIIRSDLFTIKAVDVQMDKIGCTDINQLKNSIQLLGQNIFLINSSKIKSDLKNNFLCIKDVQFSRNFPNKISLFVFGREPQVLLLGLKNKEATKSASLENIATPSARQQETISNFVVDKEAIIFATDSKEYGIPKIYYHDQNLSLGQRAEGFIFDSLKILEKVKTYSLDVKESEILDGVLLLYTKPKIIFKLSQDIDTQFASLQLILNQARIDEKELVFIDLRFDKPIIRLAPK